MTRTVLVTGAGGQVGREATVLFERAGWNVVAHAHGSLDIADRPSVLDAVSAAKPDWVLNLAAWNAVDLAETEEEAAFAVNAIAVRHLAEASERVGARLCHVSTDYVFDGTKDGPYVEWDRTNPRSAYGRSKEAGEREVPPDGLVVRTSWVCGRHGGNVVKTVLGLAADPDRTLAFVTDQVGCPTMAADLARHLLELVDGGHRGTFHVTNSGAVSWYEFVQEILEAGGHSRDRVRPILTSEMDPPRPAPRPANSVLDHRALRLSGLAEPRHFTEALAELVAQLA
ncbi:MAG: dTDP-4-dehydrorhamnose reductase [Acidimicrobiales bacterium]|nr:dTDP-4-dehydrorhamnose reductase [Acidimicrobiales bacterium]